MYFLNILSLFLFYILCHLVVGYFTNSSRPVHPRWSEDDNRPECLIFGGNKLPWYNSGWSGWLSIAIDCLATLFFILFIIHELLLGILLSPRHASRTCTHYYLFFFPFFPPCSPGVFVLSFLLPI